MPKTSTTRAPQPFEQRSLRARQHFCRGQGVWTSLRSSGRPWPRRGGPGAAERRHAAPDGRTEIVDELDLRERGSLISAAGPDPLPPEPLRSAHGCWPADELHREGQRNVSLAETPARPGSARRRRASRRRRWLARIESGRPVTPPLLRTRRRLSAGRSTARSGAATARSSSFAVGGIASQCAQSIPARRRPPPRACRRRRASVARARGPPSPAEAGLAATYDEASPSGRARP
jgi:hypothetical protein